MLSVSSFVTNIAAQSVNDTRRVTEQTRKELKPSESITTTSGTERPAPPTKDLFATLLKKKYITYQDAFQAFIVIAGAQIPDPTYEKLAAFLTDNRYLPRTLSTVPPPHHYITKGETAFILMKVLRLKGGLTAHVLGLNNRRAFNEMRASGIMWKGYFQEPVTGREFVYCLSRAIDMYIPGAADD